MIVSLQQCLHLCLDSDSQANKMSCQNWIISFVQFVMTLVLDHENQVFAREPPKDSTEHFKFMNFS